MHASSFTNRIRHLYASTGNIGAPAAVNDQMIASSFGRLSGADNNSHITPGEKIEPLRGDIADAHYDGKPAVFDEFIKNNGYIDRFEAPLFHIDENPILTHYVVGLKHDHTGLTMFVVRINLCSFQELEPNSCGRFRNFANSVMNR